MTPVTTTNERSDAVADKTKVRVTIEPGVVREVDDAELTDLHRQGILHSYEHTDHASDVLGGTVKTPGRWKDAEKGEDIIVAPPALTDPAGDQTDTKGA